MEYIEGIASGIHLLFSGFELLAVPTFRLMMWLWRWPAEESFDVE